jgi:hypothetical protein
LVYCAVKFPGDGGTDAVGVGAGTEDATAPLRHSLGIGPKICSIVLVTSTGVFPATFIASMILWFIGHGQSGVFVSVRLT